LERFAKGKRGAIFSPESRSFRLRLAGRDTLGVAGGDEAKAEGGEEGGTKDPLDLRLRDR